MHAIFRRAVKLYGLPANPLASVDRFRVRRSGDIEVFSPEEVWSLVRAAGLRDRRGDLPDRSVHRAAPRRAARPCAGATSTSPASTIRVRASYAAGQLTTPKSGKVRAVPMAPDVASALARLGQRERFIGDDDFVFAGEAGPAARRRRAQQPISRRARRGLGYDRLRFHDLRHTFGTRMIREADIRRVQEWMGHADIQTTMKYLHYESREEDAELVAQAFGGSNTDEVLGGRGVTP